MSRRLKELIVAELADRYRGMASCLVVGYHGLTAADSNRLRKALGERRFRIEVVKNSLATRALTQSGLEKLSAFISGPSAIISGEGEMPALCRTVSEWVKGEKKLEVRGGLLDGVAIGAEQIEALASIPPMETLYAQILAGIQGPMLQLAWAVQSVGRSLARALEGVRAKREDAGDSAPASAPEGEPATE